MMANTPRVMLVTDKLSLGGTERHLVNLAVGLKRRRYEVSALVYWPDDFFVSLLTEAGIPVKRVAARNRLHLVLAMRKAIRQSRSDVVIAFQNMPNALVELTGLPRRDYAVIVSEFSLDAPGRNLRRRVRHNLHRLADAVVINSYAQRERISELAPYLDGHSHIIVNGVDLKRFSPHTDDGNTPKYADQLRLLTLARIRGEKNPFGLLDAVEIVRRERPTLRLTVDWYGDPVVAADKRVSKWEFRSRRKWAEYHSRLNQAIAERCMQDVFRLHPAVKDPAPLYYAADAVCVPSFIEGTSNVICEAMACGVPLLVSRVSDNPRLARDGRNGFWFDPKSPQDIAYAIMRFADTPPDARRKMGLEGRRMAETMLQESVFVERYIDLIEKTLLQIQRRRNLR